MENQQPFGEGNCFQLSHFRSIKEHYQAYQEFEKNHEGVLQNVGIPLFLDTSVLLNLYRVGNQDRDNLLRQITNGSGQFRITPKVEEEFISQRHKQVEKIGGVPLQQIKSELTRTIEDYKKATGGFLDRFSKVLKDLGQEEWSIIEGALKEGIDALEKVNLGEKLDILLDAAKSDRKRFGVKDPVLEVLSTLAVTEKLSQDELDALTKKHADYMAKPSESTPVFPGKGEAKDTNQHGDFIIFHEMLHYMRLHGTHAAFLTLDVKKGDWMEKNGDPILSYIEQSFFLTGQSLIIMNAKDFFEDVRFNPEGEAADSLGKQVESETSDSVSSHLMRMVLASQSHYANIRLGLYYHETHRGYREHQFIGLYWEKSVRAIGKVQKVIRVKKAQAGTLELHDGSAEVDAAETGRILEAIEEARSERDWDISHDTVFFLVEVFAETDFRKTSPYAPMGPRYFDLEDYLPELKTGNLTTAEIARRLCDQTWK